MQPLPNDAPEDARPTPPEVRLRAITRAEHVLLGFPLALFPPLVLAAALAHTVPAAASWAIAVVGTVVIWLVLCLRPSIGFTADALIAESMLGRRSIPWAAIRGIAFDEVTDSDTAEVVYRMIAVRYLREPGRPLPEAPTVFGEFREWNKAYFRTVRLPLPFPPTQADGARRDKPASRLARRRERMRAIVLRELAGRGYNLSGDA